MDKNNIKTLTLKNVADERISDHAFSILNHMFKYKENIDVMVDFVKKYLNDAYLTTLDDDDTNQFNKDIKQMNDDLKLQAVCNILLYGQYGSYNSDYYYT